MFKWLMELIYGKKKSKVSSKKKIEPSISGSIRIVDNESAQEAINNGRTEILADGFVYRYPVTDGNTTIFPNNVQNAVNFIMSAKNKSERDARKGLYSQIAARETKQMMDSLEKRINRKIAEEK